MTWEEIAKLLRRRGFNYQETHWLLAKPGVNAYRVVVQRCDPETEEVYEGISAERRTLVLAYRAVLKESDKSMRPRKV